MAERDEAMQKMIGNCVKLNSDILADDLLHLLGKSMSNLKSSVVVDLRAEWLKMIKKVNFLRYFFNNVEFNFD